MTQAIKTTVVMVCALFLLLLSAIWAWGQLTKPFPKSEPPPICTVKTFETGSTIEPSDVLVSVFNASRRDGLASQVMAELVERGFVKGDTGNAPDTAVKRLQVWHEEKTNPGARMVARQLPGTKVRPGQKLGDGIVVIVGQDYTKLGPIVKQLTVKQPGPVCVPPAPVDTPVQ